MAQGAAGRFQSIFHAPGNPQLPTLPNPGDPATGLLVEYGDVPGITTGRPPAPIELEVLGAAPGVARGYAQTWLNQVGATPTLLDFGSITATKQRTFVIHNTNRFDIQVTAVDLSALPGVTLVSPGLPVTIEPHDSAVFTVEAAQIGEPSFDDAAVVTTSVNTLLVRMVGRRVIIFNSRPQRPIPERISFLTDNMVTVAGNEQAFSLRVAPRSTVTYDLRMTDRIERARLIHQLAAVSFLRCGVQLWFQSREVDQAIADTDTVIQVNTDNMEIVAGGLLSFVSPDYATVVEGEVDSFTASSVTLTQPIGTAFPIGTSVMPLKFGFANPRVQQASFPVNVEDVRVSIDLIEYENIGELVPGYFDTHPVDGLPIITHPLYFRGQSRAGSIENDIPRLDSLTGDINAWQNEPLGRPVRPVLVRCESLADQHAWRKFLHFVRGSWGVFYVPTGTDDLPLRDPLSLGGNTFVIDNLQLATLIGTQAPWRDVEMVVQGVRYFRRINSVVDNGATETITLDSAIPGTGTVPADSVRVSWLTPVRIVGDTATFTHLRRGDSELRFQVRGVIS